MSEQRADQPGWEAELFRLLVDNTKDYAVFVVDPEGRVLTWNPGAARVLGHKEEEIVGESSFMTFTLQDREQDVPEKELQRALAEGRLRIALDAADMGTWLWRIPTDEQVLDESLRRLMGLRPEDAVMTLDDFLRAVHAEDRGRVRAEFQRCLGGEVEFSAEFRVVWPDGSLHWLRDQGKVFMDRQGAPLFMTGACVDITERKRAEEELIEADRKKDEFLALLAHELRNPLAPLRNGLQVMRLAPGDAACVGEARAMMERQLSHMVRLIDDLLDVSRLSQKKLRLQKSRVLLADVIGIAVETARPAIEGAGHELTVSIPPEPVFLDADLTRLAQVFSNLLTNCAKYTETGGRIWKSGRKAAGLVR